VNTTGYIIDVLLILVVLRQVRKRQLTAQSVLLPVALLAIAGVTYLKSFSLAGNDLVLIVIFTVIGVVLGTISGVTTRVWRDGVHGVVAQAGVVAAASWILGMAFRFAFALWANTSSGGAALGRFSYHHDITSAQAWTTALFLMAFGEVLSRVGYLQFRRVRLERASVAAVDQPKVKS
jgi:hypothetical protein